MSLRQAPSRVLSSSIRQPICIQCRHLHKRAAQPIPAPTPFVPDTEAFLTLIGRKSSQHASKIPSWEALFTLSSEELKASGIEPARSRRYLLWWRDRYRNGIMGIGGDLKQVENGVAELRVAQVPSKRKIDQEASATKDAGVRKVIINTPPSEPSDDKTGRLLRAALQPLQTVEASSVPRITGVRLGPGDVIAGHGIEPVKGQPGVARLRVQEGLWEQKRGHKVDGGERRKAEVRFKRRAAERKAAR